jgi:transposase
LARTAETMRDLFACPLSVATIQRAAAELSRKLLPAEARLKGALAGAEVVGADETGWRVQNAGGYVHVARTDDLTHYGYDPRRGQGAMDDIGILPRFTGTLVRDGFPSYQWYGCRHSLCNAHLLRDLAFIGESCPAHRAWTQELTQLLRDVKAQVSLSAEGLNAAQQETYRQRYEQVLRQGEAVQAAAPPGSSPRARTPQALLRRLRKKRDDILRFMSDPAVPFDNNGSERDLRMIKLQQKISGCFRTQAGANRFCRIRSYLSSAKKQVCSLLQALERALHGKPLTLPRKIQLREATYPT